MINIDELLEMAQVLNPHAKKEPRFSVFKGDDGKWVARIESDQYFTDCQADTPNAATQNLREALVNHGQSLVNRFQKLITKWTSGIFSKPRLVQSPIKKN